MTLAAPRRAAGIAGALLAIVLAACSTGPTRPPPAPLEAFTPQIAGRSVWNARIDGVGFPLAVAARDGQFTVASDGGTVLALDAATGRELWRADIGDKLSAGVGSDGRFAAVVTRGGELVVLDGAAVKWRKSVGGRVTTAPLVAGERVFVLGVDRAVHAYDVLDGRKLWVLQRPGDPLTLSQAGPLLAFKDTLVAGQGPRLAGVDPLRGSLRWEVAVASPRGTNEVERLADLVAPPVRVGDTVCARAFQAAVGCVNAERGTLLWSRNVGGTTGIAGDADYVFGGDGADRLTAWRTSSGEVAWTSEKLLNRGLSAPLSLGPTVVFGDLEGQVHWLSRDKGDTLLRLPTDGSPVAAAPALSGTTMLVVTRKGGLFAFRPE
jgi:outer membrane assembly lipoprotein YfgL